jgi:hypothetical protein
VGGSEEQVGLWRKFSFSVGMSDVCVLVRALCNHTTRAGKRDGQGNTWFISGPRLRVMTTRNLLIWRTPLTIIDMISPNIKLTN